MSMTSHCHWAGFCARLQAHPNPPQRDMPDDHHPDPDETADFELPDQQALIDNLRLGSAQSRLKMKLCSGAAAAPRTLRPGRRGAARCDAAAAAPRTWKY